ncbi:MAG: hypothetical protein P1U41_03675 [Vicingaceae bacterium]|nr:hypothetical protein [Vicingaceae bacterium]
MNKILPFVLLFTLSYSVYSQDKVKPRKMSYSDFTKDFGVNDTASVVIDLFFDKKDNGAYGEMLFLPITVGLAAIPQTKAIGIPLTLISAPLFLHGCYILIKYRKGKLYKVLSNYKRSKELPKWLQKKVDKQLGLYKVVDREY